ncbi:MAG TPA: PEP-CTERM sorting domain-containing protein [Lacipirellulaceae bacterium]|nr:PEP-CTERM sorting domain-containing protein [Lacipirellulaceae bacterium]
MYRPESKFLKAALAAAACVCAVVSQASAAIIDLTPQGGNGTVSSAVSLASLLADPTGSVTVGDKVFTGFGYSGTNDMPAAANVNVLGLKDADGNWGLRFQGAFQDQPGDGASDAHISFMVEVPAAQAAQGWRITDAHLAINGAATGGDDSYFIVDETLSNGQALEAYVTTLGPGNVLQSQLTDEVIFAPVTKLNVVKDILAEAASGNFLPARGTVIDQSFSQELIPEPTSITLLGLSGLAMVGVARRRGVATA